MYENKYKAAGSIYAVEYDVYDVHIVAGQLHDEDELGQLQCAVIQMPFQNIDFSRNSFGVLVVQQGVV